MRDRTQWLRYTFGLTYLKPQNVEECFTEDLMPYKPYSLVDDRLDKYIDYLLEMFVIMDARFPTWI